MQVVLNKGFVLNPKKKNLAEIRLVVSTRKPILLYASAEFNEYKPFIVYKCGFGL